MVRGYRSLVSHLFFLSHLSYRSHNNAPISFTAIRQTIQASKHLTPVIIKHSSKLLRMTSPIKKTWVLCETDLANAAVSLFIQTSTHPINKQNDTSLPPGNYRVRSWMSKNRTRVAQQLWKHTQRVAVACERVISFQLATQERVKDKVRRGSFSFMATFLTANRRVNFTNLP